MKASNQRNIHPFPARMAPEIAIQALEELNLGDTILDPMVGSGTVLHHAAQKGFSTIGFDLDPLALLMSKVRTSKINLTLFDALYHRLSDNLSRIKLTDITLDWIDQDEETRQFVKFWFGRKQINGLRKIAYLLHCEQKKRKCVELDALRLAFSRIIVTKKVGASLAWDISHSRPHKVRDTNDYDVIAGYHNSVKTIRKLLEANAEFKNKTNILLGDARDLKIPNGSVDRVITSPPYLNAIDYMRGHKFSLVWFGYSISELRKIRTIAIGVEKKISIDNRCKEIDTIFDLVLPNSLLKPNQEGMVKRYIQDSISLMSEISRVLKIGKQATLVIGNSNLNGQNVENSEIFKHAAILNKLIPIRESIREIPVTKRYLPLGEKNSMLNKRMKHEVVISFLKTA